MGLNLTRAPAAGMLQSFDAAEMGPLKDMLRPALAEERRGAPAPAMMEGGQALIGHFLLASSDMPNVSLRAQSEMVALIHEGGRATGAVLRGPQGEQRIERRSVARPITPAAIRSGRAWYSVISPRAI